MSKKVVVFGGSGFIGSYVVDELSRRGYSVLVADRNQPTHNSQGVEFQQVDILDLEKVKTVCKNSDYVFNFSAIANINDSNEDPFQTFDVNIKGNLNILEGCRFTGNIERFIYASSAYALSNEGSFYGISKQTSEKMTEEYFRRYGLKFSIIRYGSVYGEKKSGNNYIYNLLKTAVVEKKLVLQGTGEEIREYIHAADAAKLSVDMLEDTQYENEHIILTGVEKYKRAELFTMIKEIMGDEVNIDHKNEVQKGHYKITPYAFQPKLAKKLVANPFIDLGQGLVECLKVISEENE